MRLAQFDQSSAIPSLSRDNYSDLVGPFPSLETQRRIVARIDALFAEIEEGEQALAEARAGVETYRKALLKAAVTGELTADWRAGNLAATTGEDLREKILANRKIQKPSDENAATQEELFPIPESWCWSRLGDLFAIAVGATPNRSDASLWHGSVPWVSSGEVSFRRIASTREMISPKAVGVDRIQPRGTVMLGMIGEGRTRGQAAILDIPSAHNQNCASIRVSVTPIPPEFVYWWLEYQYERTRAEGAGGNQPALNKARVAAISMPLPPKAELDEIVRLLTAHFEDTLETEGAITDASQGPNGLRQAILAIAFKGELAS